MRGTRDLDLSVRRGGDRRSRVGAEKAPDPALSRYCDPKENGYGRGDARETGKRNGEKERAQPEGALF